MKKISRYQDYTIRQWQFADRSGTTAIVSSILAEYGLNWEPDGADGDVMDIETYYFDRGGDFWVVEENGQLVGTSAYYPSSRGVGAVEIRKMYLLPSARGRGLGRYLLGQLERVIAKKGHTQIWIETASRLQEAVRLYELNGYQAATGVETLRCDRVYVKHLTPVSGQQTGVPVSGTTQ
jgi:putative acetyltransferase